MDVYLGFLWREFRWNIFLSLHVTKEAASFHPFKNIKNKKKKSAFFLLIFEVLLLE